MYLMQDLRALGVDFHSFLKVLKVLKRLNKDFETALSKPVKPRRWARAGLNQPVLHVTGTTHPQ